MVNKRFFMDIMKDRQMSLREVAKRIDVWPAALSRSLDGKRKMQIAEAGSQAAYCDGWLTFFSEEHNPIAVIGHFVLAHLEDGSMRSGAIRRGYETGTYNLLGPIYGHLKNIRIKSARRAILTIHS